MNKLDILKYLEDEQITIEDKWFLHATSTDIEVIKKILIEGITCAHLRKTKGSNFNGKYYISLYNPIESNDINKWLRKEPKLIIQDINPIPATRTGHLYKKLFINTRLPIRMSEWDGEYQQYLKIHPDKIIAIDYSISTILSECDEDTIKQKLHFLKELASYTALPIYDLATKRKINKEKVLSLKL